MPINSRAKGAAGERELSHFIKEKFGWQARRTQQFCGDSGDSDVVIEELPGIFVECKRVAKLNLAEAMETALRQCKTQVPVVCHRTNRGGWMLTVPLAELVRLATMVCAATPVEQSDPSSLSDTTCCQSRDSVPQPRPCVSEQFGTVRVTGSEASHPASC